MRRTGSQSSVSTSTLDLVGEGEVLVRPRLRVAVVADGEHLAAAVGELRLGHRAHRHGQGGAGQAGALGDGAVGQVRGDVVRERLADAVLHLRLVAGHAGRRPVRVAAHALLLGRVDDAVLALLVHVDLLVVGPHVAGAAGDRLHRLLGGEHVSRVAGVALAHRAVIVGVADVVAALAHLVALGLGHDLVPRPREHARPALGVLVDVGPGAVLDGELRVLVGMAVGARAGGDLALGGRDDEMVGAVAVDAGGVAVPHRARLVLRDDAGGDGRVALDALCGRVRGGARDPRRG